MSISHLEDQLAAWFRKPSLREVYRHWFKEVQQWLLEGPTFEIGSGIGRLSESIEDIVTIDILKTPWTDIVGTAESLPMRRRSVSNLVLFDVLHHLPRPTLFFHEALRVLQDGGRVIVSDPYVSPLSTFVYKHFHPEPVDIDCDPFQPEVPLSSTEPFDANQAIGTLLFYRQLEKWQEQFSKFEVIFRKRFAFIAYPATGGFGFRSLLPGKVISWIQDREKLLSPLSPVLAFRLLVVLEKKYSMADGC